jgi:hypothetical protein
LWRFLLAGFLLLVCAVGVAVCCTAGVLEAKGALVLRGRPLAVPLLDGSAVDVLLLVTSSGSVSACSKALLVNRLARWVGAGGNGIGRGLLRES